MKIDELLKESKIKYQKLKEVAEIGTGCSNRQDAIENGNYPFYVRSKEIQRIDTFEFDEEAIIIPGEGGIGDIFHYVNGKYALHQRAYRIHFFDDKINVKFAYYYLINYFKSFILTKAVNATVTSIRKPMIEDFEIPCLPIGRQQAIVNVLDKFTKLEAELEAELEARKKQYEHYRNELVVNDKWLMVNLGEIAEFSQGIQVDLDAQYEEIDDGLVRFLRIVDFVKDDEKPRFIKNPGIRYLKKEGDLIMIRYGASAAGKVFLKFDGAIANNMFQIKLKTEKITTKFLHTYLSQDKIYKSLNSGGGTSTMPAITFSQIGSVQIPIPPLEEQSRIVSILDKFDKLVNDISEGLPAEIKMRRQQYEYYRNKLLTFV